MSAQQRPVAFDAKAGAERIHAEVSQLLSTFLGCVSGSNQSELLQPGGPDFQY